VCVTHSLMMTVESIHQIRQKSIKHGFDCFVLFSVCLVDDLLGTRIHFYTRYEYIVPFCWILLFMPSPPKIKSISVCSPPSSHHLYISLVFVISSVVFKSHTWLDPQHPSRWSDGTMIDPHFRQNCQLMWSASTVYATDNEDPYPSLSDFHDYEPNLEFDDTELEQAAASTGKAFIMKIKFTDLQHHRKVIVILYPNAYRTHFGLNQARSCDARVVERAQCPNSLSHFLLI
jgi:hypothetical protein